MNFQEFVNDYYERFIVALRDFDKRQLDGVLAIVDDVLAAEGNLWAAGNGGSAAIANHTVCDMTKGTHVHGADQFRCHSLTSNVPMLTAIGNDISYDDVFSTQLGYYAKPGDALLLVSSSGNSPNVLKACEVANAMGLPTIAFVGFKGGKLRDLAKVSVWIPVENYGIVEDAHQSLIHCLSQYIKARSVAGAAKG
jgi:D-sedoheptulose 7-phosphate isomerase